MYENQGTPRPQNKKSNKTKFLVGTLAVCAVAAAVIATVTYTNSSTTSIKENASTASGNPNGLSVDMSELQAYRRNPNFLRILLNKKDSDQLGLIIPKSTLGKSVIVHSIFNRGFYHETKHEDAPYITNHMPAETTDRVVFHFELSENKQSIKYIREQWKIRTTDREMKYALKEGAWVAHEASLPIVKKYDGVYVVDASELAANGFFVTQLGQEKYEIEMKGTRSFEKNANFVVNYFLPKGLLSSKENIHPEWQSIHFSMMLLPEKQMTSRVADDRIGYFSSKYTDLGLHNGLYSENKNGQQKVEQSKSDNITSYERQSVNIDSKIWIIHRRRLEVRNGKVIKPIKFHIDPSIPKTWRKYFKSGVESWNDAFAAAGLPGAVRAVLPEDRDWPKDYHVGDLRYSSISFAISYSGGALAIGPSVVDPRSGEILSSDIQFSSTWAKLWLGKIETDSPQTPSKMKTMKLKYFHERAVCHLNRMEKDRENLEIIRMASGYQSGVISEEIIGAGFKDVTAHEVGHTLGLRHNFIATTARTISQLKDSEYTKKHGLSSSYMDYVPINIWSDMSQEAIDNNTWFTGNVGEYDVEAIKYGYKVLKGEKSGIKHPELTKIARDAPLFATDEDASIKESPFIKRYDMSDEPLKYFIDKINLIKRLRKNVIDRNVMKDETWTRLWRIESRFLKIIKSATTSMSLYIGGVYSPHAHKDSHHPNGPQIQYISKSDQLSAIDAMLSVALGENDVFPSPSSYKNYVERTGTYGVKSANVDALIQECKNETIFSVLDNNVMKRIVKMGSAAPVDIATVIVRVAKKIISNTDPENAVIFSYFISAMKVLKKSDEPRVALIASNILEKILERRS